MKKLRPLTKEEIFKINRAIAQKTNEDDRDSFTIIKKDYDGDIDDYLRTMAKLHGIPIEDEDID